MSSCKPCTMEYSRGNGTGVAEAVGNWGFSNEVASPGHELSRMQCLLERMEALKEKPKCPSSSGSSKHQAQCCYIMECNPPMCRSSSSHSKIKPLINHGSIEETLFTNNRRVVRDDRNNPILGRRYVLHGNDKWYKLGPLCCPQPSCPAPYCPPCEKVYFC